MKIKVVLDELLFKKDIKKYRLAKDIGVEYGTVHKLCSGKTKSISFELLAKICTYLDCNIEDILKLDKE